MTQRISKLEFLISDLRKVNMKNFGIIYKITNEVNGKIYVGQTIRSMNDRWTDHKRDAVNGVDYPLYFAMRKYGVENFNIVCLDSASSLDDLNQKEKLWIKELNSLCKNEKGYNVVIGGLGLGSVNSQPTINLSSGMEFDSASKMAEFYNLSYDFVLKVLNGHKRMKNKEILRYKDLKKQRQANIRASFVPFHKALPKKILCLDTKEYFESIKSASEKLGILRTSIGNNLAGRSKSAGGLRFVYTESQLSNGEDLCHNV